MIPHEPVAYFRDRIVPASQARISIYDLGIIMGATVTDMARTYRHIPFRLDDHLNRFFESCRYARITPRISKDEMLGVILDIVRENSRALQPTEDLSICIFITPGENPIYAGAAAAGGQQFPVGALYVVATPIGNLADLTLRAVQVLSLCDAVACEDTRNGLILLRHLGLSKPLLSLHAHNEAQGSERVLGLLAQGQRVAYLSDAGTPAVSDPGAVLVAHVSRAGHRVIPIPGVSSAVTALKTTPTIASRVTRPVTA